MVMSSRETRRYRRSRAVCSPSGAGTGSADSGGGEAGLLRGQVVESLGEEPLAERLVRLDCCDQRGRAAHREQVGGVVAGRETGVAGVHAVGGEYPEVPLGSDL